jgi:hypothetical protein
MLLRLVTTVLLPVLRTLLLIMGPTVLLTLLRTVRSQATNAFCRSQ